MVELVDQNASEAAPKLPESDGRWHCPICESAYAQRHNVLRHLQDVHGYLSDTAYREKHGLPLGMGRRAKKAQQPQSEGESRGRTELKATVFGPLRTRLRNIDRRIEKLQGELVELRDEKRDIEFVLKRLDPSSFVSSSSAAASSPRSPDREKTALIRGFIEEHVEELEAGFTQTSLHEMIRANGIVGVVSPVTVGSAIEELRDAGLVRADKIVKGGGMQFVFVGSNGAQAGDDDAEA